MKKLKFLWGRVAKGIRELVIAWAITGFVFGGGAVITAMSGSGAWGAAWAVGWPAAMLITALYIWVSEQLTDYEDPPEPQKPRVEPDPFGGES